MGVQELKKKKIRLESDIAILTEKFIQEVGNCELSIVVENISLTHTEAYRLDPHIRHRIKVIIRI